MKNNFHCEILERAAFQMTSSLNLGEVLTTITKGLVEELDAPLARIWLLHPGDICSQCHQASVCSNRELCLHLSASDGIKTSCDGDFRRFPIGSLHIGQIARFKEPFIKKNLYDDARFPNQAWLMQNDIRSHAGFPLVFREQLLGVMSVFSQSEFVPGIVEHLSGFANQASIAIKNAQLFAEVEQLKNRLQAENVYMQEEIKLIHNFEELIGSSDEFKHVLQKVEQVAPTDATVLIRGESGTGKELVARAIHNISPRSKRPLVKVNCAALPSTLIENELFGHEKGAYTGAVSQKIGRFELANGGTIFLDEIGDLPFDTQSKLLRIIEDGEFEPVGGIKTKRIDVRIIAATNHYLEELIENGSFREDLYYRLNVFPIKIPPLRERKVDIPYLVKHFIRKYSEKLGKKIDTIPPKIMLTFQKYHWPGNIRELENIIERSVIISKTNIIQTDGFLDFQAHKSSGTSGLRTLRDVEQAHILRVLDETNWVIEGKQGAATRLDIHPATLRSRMKKLGIKRPQ
ncbi:MAG: sigma-54-dependent Fis family transcriptional regulator [Planctomycetota bacterium]|jgi:transcriptional regulator with GAF, ATPase, and Fis domain